MFNAEKLDWFNQQHLMRLAPDELARRLKPWFEQAGLWDDEFLGDRHAWFFAVLELLKPRAKRLDEFAALGRFFFTDAIDYDEAAIDEASARSPIWMGTSWRSTRRCRASTPSMSVATEAALRAVAEARGVKAASLIHAVRVAVTGKTVSPGLFEVARTAGPGARPRPPRGSPPSPVDLAFLIGPCFFRRSTRCTAVA